MVYRFFSKELAILLDTKRVNLWNKGSTVEYSCVPSPKFSLLASSNNFVLTLFFDSEIEFITNKFTKVCTLKATQLQTWVWNNLSGPTQRNLQTLTTANSLLVLPMNLLS